MDRKKQLQKEEEEEKEKAERQKDYRPFIQQDEDKRDFHDSLNAADFMTIDQRETMRELDDSQLVGPPPPLPPLPPTASTVLVVPQDVHMADVQVTTAAPVPVVTSAKRKRGRPPRAQGKTVPSPPPPPQRKPVDEEEDVCFICFDGGSLVLCDRRGCPKAYHPTCIKRDEAFFRSKAKWNCGWHICSSCQKASYYMCYTCTYSLCKGCTKDADYVCVRDNKGFCGTCMKTIMLIEKVKMENVEQVQVDFDDKTSWEYLFKVYWVYLKDKLSLTVDELTNAKNPWKGDELPKARNSWKRNGFAARKEVLTGEHLYANNEKVSCLDNCTGNGEGTLFKRRKTNDQSDQIEKNTTVMENSTVEKATPLPEGMTWATKALLEFVAHMKDGDSSMLSQSDVQALLLEYIKRNNLRDPRQQCEVVCDARLTNLFRKPRVGHLEMLKLLEYHFLTKEKSQPDDTIKTTVAGTLSRQFEGAGCSDSQLVLVNDKQRKTRKKMNEKASPINPNPDEYAAIDVHNINLLYLKCNLMEKLLDDPANFHEKVVGSFVRIRIAVGDKKQDVHRLVQVVGTCKTDESYKVGSRTINMKLEILNLDKKEVISIDGISDQDFSEDECRRLRETIKCGLIKRLKVGEIQEKAMVLQPVKVTDCLEAEILRWNNLRDRASENGHRKDLRECVEKLELLQSPKERERRLLEIPSVHMDPKMDPSYASEEDAEDRDENKQGDHVRLNDPGVARKGIELNSSPGEGDLNDIGHRALKTLAAASEQVEMNSHVDPEGNLHSQEQGNDSVWSRGAVEYGLSMPNTSKNQLGGSGSVTVDWSSPAPVTSESVPSVASSVIPTPLSSGSELPVSDFETEKLWHYQDPSGKIQGPFSMVQLRKWSEISIFPDDFRVWRINEKQQDSILLTDALIGRFPKEPLPHLLPQEATVACEDAEKKGEHGHGHGTDVTWEDNKRADHEQKPLPNDNNNELAKSNGLDSHTISLIKAADAAVNDDSQAQASLQVWELPEGSKSSTGQSQICISLPAPSSSGKSCEGPLLNEREGSFNPSNANMDSHRTSETNAKDNGEKRAESEGHSSQSSGENWRPQSMNSSTSGWDSNSGFLSMVKSVEKSEQHQKFDFSNLPSTAPMQANDDLKNQVAENKLSASLNVPVQDSGPPSWSTASSLVIGGRQVPEVAVDWLSYSSAPALKPTEGTGDHAATPTSGMDQLTLSSSNHPTIDASSWHPMVPEPNEFCSLVDESVSDLLAEVEAMESLGGLPSPTSKLRYDLELTPGSDDDCFSPVERFSPAPDQGKSDALSSTGDIQIPSQLSVVEESLRLSLMPSQPTITNEPLAVSQMSAQLDVINKPPHLAQIQRQGIIPNEPLRASQMPSQSTLTEEPLTIWKRDPIDPQKSFSGHSSSTAEVNGDAKRSEVSVNQWDIRLDIRPLESSAKQGQVGSDIQPPATSTVSQWEDGSNKHPASTVDASRRNDKGNANLNRGGVPQGNTNIVWGSGQGSIQQQGSTNSAVSTGNQGNWGSQPRHGSESRHSGQRDHRNHYQSRDSGSGRDRSSWNRQPMYGSAGNGGGSFKGPSKGQRVCKFYESGYCKKGASCSYWHP